MRVIHKKGWNTWRNIKEYRIILFLCLTCWITAIQVTGQCTTSSSVAIPDNSQMTVQFSVAGLLDNDLASPTQGICGVELQFNHEYLGDLTVTLISPSGTSITLIGPPTTVITPTNLSAWNIDFVPCTSPASPDPGFMDTWSNLQAWQALTPYTGTYYPTIGCLEDFNTGPANGTWQIILQDHDQFQVGNLISATLIFCNPNGLNCIECSPNAGILSPPSFTICSGENIQSSDVTIDFGGSPPSPALYTYEYLLLNGNTIIQHGTNFSFTPPVGNFMLCGLSYLTSDAPIINSLLYINDYNTLVQAINEGVVCGDTTTCIPLTVVPVPDTLVVAGNLCNGETFSFRGQDYFSPGLFYQVYNGPGLCDTIYEIRISTRSLSLLINQPDTISCVTGSVMLNATASGASGPFTYLWTTSAGNIVSPPASASIIVDQAAQYLVSVTDGVCSGVGSVQVVAGEGFPQVFVDGGIITCNEPTVTLSPIFIPTNGIVLWTGPGGFMSTRPDTFVNQPGTYVIRVTNAAGCTASTSVEIGIDTATQAISIVNILKNCQTGFLTLGYEVPGQIVNQQWTGPNNFLVNTPTANISDAGVYMLTITFPNGCQRSTSFNFDGDFTIPDVNVSMDDTLNCNEIITLTVSSTTPGVNYTWNGPQNLFITQPIIQITQEGTYHGTVIAPNGCRNSDMVNIERGSDLFDFQPLTDTITCLAPTGEIGVVSTVADLYRWIDFNGPDSLESSIIVSAPGTYQVIMTDTATGCIVIGSVQVSTNLSVPVYSFITDTISCNEPIATLQFISVPGNQYLDIQWTLPDMTTINSVLINVDQPGQYGLLVIGENGCAGTSGLSVWGDTIPPLFFIEADTLNCERTGMLRSVAVDSIVQFSWSGPNMFLSNLPNPMIIDSGMYVVTGTGVNGCELQLSINVIGDFIPPEVIVTSDSLTCLFANATLHVTSPDSILSYKWANENQIIIGNDSTVLVNNPGLYTISIEGSNHCISLDSIFIDPILFPGIQIISDTITCSATIVVQAEANTDLPNAQFTWFDLNGNVLSLLPVVNITGYSPVVLVVTGQNGCASRDTIVAPVDTMPPIPIIELIGEVRCQNLDVMFDGSASSPMPLLYTWTTTGGTILSDVTLPLISAIDTGVYRLTVQRLDNSCVATDSFHLTNHPDAITMAELNIISQACTGDENAAIEILGLQGGVGPFLYEINGGAPQLDPFFDGLEAGTFQLTITDTEGCQYDTTIIIDSVFFFTVDAGPDIEIYLGETAELSGMTDLFIQDIMDSRWDSLDIALCMNCPTFEVTPWETTTYEFQITSASGCVKSDDMIVYVVEKAKYYIANVFSPNGDNLNDEVRINASPGIEKVLQWIIFDRWGNAVFGKTNFDPDDPSIFWNGKTSTGDFANPAVFPYLLEVQLVNGKSEIFHGDITLLR